MLANPTERPASNVKGWLGSDESQAMLAFALIPSQAPVSLNPSTLLAFGVQYAGSERCGRFGHQLNDLCLRQRLSHL